MTNYSFDVLEGKIFNGTVKRGKRTLNIVDQNKSNELNKIMNSVLVIEIIDLKYLKNKVNQIKNDINCFHETSRLIDNPIIINSKYYNLITEQILKETNEAELDQIKMEYLDGLSNEIAIENIDILFRKEYGNHISFIYSMMQDYGYDHCDPKKSNYNFVLKELINFAVEFINKTNRIKYYMKDKEENYGPQVKLFLKHHSYHTNDRKAISTFFITPSKVYKNYFPDQYYRNNKRREKQPKKKNNIVVNAEVMRRFQTTFGLDSYLEGLKK